MQTLIPDVYCTTIQKDKGVVCVPENIFNKIKEGLNIDVSTDELILPADKKHIRYLSTHHIVNNAPSHPFTFSPIRDNEEMIMEVDSDSVCDVMLSGRDDGNEIKIYFSEENYLKEIPDFMETISKDEPISFKGVPPESIIKSTRWFTGYSSSGDVSEDKVIPLITYHLTDREKVSFKEFVINKIPTPIDLTESVHSAHLHTSLSNEIPSDLVGINPWSNNLTTHEQLLIEETCLVNPSYYFNHVVRVPKAFGGNNTNKYMGVGNSDRYDINTHTNLTWGNISPPTHWSDEGMGKNFVLDFDPWGKDLTDEEYKQLLDMVDKDPSMFTTQVLRSPPGLLDYIKRNKE